MAAESPFAGERANALAAAERLAARKGMSLDEAALGGPPPPQRPRQRDEEQRAARAFARAIILTDYQLQADKVRRDAALREAMARGLDADERKKRPARASFRLASTQGRGRNQMSHARVLLSETSLPLQEVASITGLDIYQVVGLKLKMRKPSRSL